jgi:hypothetical protein
VLGSSRTRNCISLAAPIPTCTTGGHDHLAHHEVQKSFSHICRNTELPPSHSTKSARTENARIHILAEPASDIAREAATGDQRAYNSHSALRSMEKAYIRTAFLPRRAYELHLAAVARVQRSPI